MDRHCENALAVANHLKNHPKVNWVQYAGLPDNPSKPLVDKYMNGKVSSILTFGIKGGLAAGTQFIEALKLITRLRYKIAGVSSSQYHNRQLSPEELAKAGVTDDMVRLSIGLEHIDDILADIDQAL